MKVTRTPASGPARVERTAYDAEGRVTRVDSPEGTAQHRYDALGRLTRTFTGEEADPVNDTRYTYDALGRLATVEAWERNDVLVDADPATPGQQPEATRYEYDLVGNLDLERKANGVVSDYEYDGLNRLTKLTHLAPDGDPLASFEYTVRADGRRSHADELFDVNGDGVLDPLTEKSSIDWTYDALGRLTEEVFDSYDDLLDQTQHFTYDLAGNRLEKTLDKGRDGAIDELVRSLYDANDRLTEERLDRGGDGSVEQTTTYGYAVTQQALKEVREGSVLKSRTSQAYDLQGRLSAVTVETFGLDGTTVTRREVTGYGYDAAGIRVSSRQETDADGGGPAATPSRRPRTSTTRTTRPATRRSWRR